MASTKQILNFLDSLEPSLRQAFLDDVALMKYRANIKELESAIQTGDIALIMYAAGMREGNWTNFTEALRTAYKDSGVFAINADVPKRYGMRFDVTNQRAVNWLMAHSAGLVVEINQTQREAIQSIVSAGYVDGRGPRDIALDIAGRVSKQTGRRDGGVIGLHNQFTNAAINARRDLVSLNPNYFNRTRRDARFDATVRNAIDSGKPLSQVMVNRIVGRYEDRLLETRASNIARTEAMTAVNASASEAMDQVVDEGLIERDDIEKTWDSAGDSKVRPDHVIANGQTVKQGELFIVGGYQMACPGDTTHGAGADQVCNCRCICKYTLNFAKVA